VQSSMLHGSETWPVRKENEVALQSAEMRMVRWICGIKLHDKVPSKGLRERHNFGTTAKQVAIVWHVLRKEDNDWVKKCLEYEVESARPRGRPMKTWREIVEKDCQARKLNKEDAMNRKRWSKWRGMIDDHDRCEWVNVSSGTGSPRLSQTMSRTL